MGEEMNGEDRIADRIAELQDENEKDGEVLDEALFCEVSSKDREALWLDVIATGGAGDDVSRRLFFMLTGAARAAAENDAIREEEAREEAALDAEDEHRADLRDHAE